MANEYKDQNLDVSTCSSGEWLILVIFFLVQRDLFGLSWVKLE